MRHEKHQRSYRAFFRLASTHALTVAALLAFSPFAKSAAPHPRVPSASDPSAGDPAANAAPTDPSAAAAEPAAAAPAAAAADPAAISPAQEVAFLNVVRRDFGLPQIAGIGAINVALVNGIKPSMTGSSINVNCTGGCSSSAGFPDNSAFTVGTTPILNVGALYSTSTPAISSGNAGRVRMDANSYLAVDCIVGCSASAGFADNSAFTAGTTPVGIAAGWYSSSPTNCTSGNACAPQLTVDRKLYVQAFQGTSPWVANPQPQASNSYAASASRNAAVTTSVTVKSSAGNLWGWVIYNPNSSLCVLDFYNTTSPTLGTTTPVWSVPLGSGATANVAPGSIAFANFSTAIAIAAETADGGSTTCSTGMVANISYE